MPIVKKPVRRITTPPDLTAKTLQRVRVIMALFERIRGLLFTPEEARILIEEIRSRTRV